MPKFVYDNKKEEAKKFSFEPHIAEILLKRGIDTEDKMSKFLDPFPKVEFEDTLTDEDKAVSLLKKAVLNKDEIVLYSDYDADGAMCGVIGFLALNNLGVKINVYTNNKNVDGYGLCKSGIDMIMDFYPGCHFIITADNGVAAEDIVYAKEQGFTVVVTDHHEPASTLPPADAIVDAKRKDCVSKYKDMCGAALLYRIMVKLYESLGKDPWEIENLVEFAALATISDVVPLLGLNRDIVKNGLLRINSGLCSEPIVILKSVLNLERVGSYEVAYKIAPLINSVVRLTGDISPIIKAFTSEDEEYMKKIFSWAKDLNDQRIELTERDLFASKEILKKKYGKATDFPKALVVSSNAFSEGIVGIVAGRLKSSYNRPAFVFSEKGGILTGSARSTDFINVKDMLDSMKDILLKYGGHAKAAGVTILKSNFEEFVKRVNEFVEENSCDTDFEEVVNIDSSIEAEDVTIKLVNEISKLEPFGEGFSKPMFGLNFDSSEFTTMGKEGNHLKAIDKKSRLPIICWNGADRGKSKTHFGKAIGFPQKNVFKGNESPQFIVENKFIF